MCSLKNGNWTQNITNGIIFFRLIKIFTALAWRHKRLCFSWLLPHRNISIMAQFYKSLWRNSRMGEFKLTIRGLIILFPIQKVNLHNANNKIEWLSEMLLLDTSHATIIRPLSYKRKGISWKTTKKHKQNITLWN